MKAGRLLGGFVAILLIGTLAGCGGGGGGTTTSPTTNTSSNTLSTATFSGKTFSVGYGGGTITFHADGTLSRVGGDVDTSNMTWAVNGSGQLVLYGKSQGAETYTLAGDSTNGWTGTAAYPDGTTRGVTLTPTAVLSTAMLSGKTFSASNGGAVTFNSNGTLTQVGSNTNGMTWAVNSSGQLVVYGTSKGTETFILSGDSTRGWTGTGFYADGTSNGFTLTPV